MRVIALDVGSKSCGIATSDELKITAQGRENFNFEYKDWQSLIRHLKNNYLFDVDTIVIGYPTLPSGDKSQTTLMIEDFKEVLSSQVDIDIIFFDENFSTKRAHEVMIEAGLTREKRKKKKDLLAAVIILQDYLGLI